MSKFFVEATYTFPVTFTVEAESAEAAESLIKNHCETFSIDRGVHWNPPKYDAKYEDIDWEYPVAANVTITRVGSDDGYSGIRWNTPEYDVKHEDLDSECPF